MEWIPVEERLPERDSKILITDGKVILLGRYEMYKHGILKFYTYQQGYINSKHVTHWMSLPEPPKQK